MNKINEGASPFLLRHLRVCLHNHGCPGGPDLNSLLIFCTTPNTKLRYTIADAYSAIFIEMRSQFIEPLRLNLEEDKIASVPNLLHIHIYIPSSRDENSVLRVQTHTRIIRMWSLWNQ